MSEWPILFSAPMVRAILSGKKSMTRRLLKPQPEPWKEFHLEGGCQRADWHFSCQWVPTSETKQRFYLVQSSAFYDDRFQPLPYAPGDRLWVREAGTLLKAAENHGGDDEWYPVGWQHAADDTIVGFNGNDPTDYLGDCSRRRFPSIHMPRWASRITLAVTAVRVERLQDITSAGAIAEGFAPYANSQTIDCDTPNPRDDFKAFWKTLHGAGAWDANPWVAVISFERVTP